MKVFVLICLIVLLVICFMRTIVLQHRDKDGLNRKLEKEYVMHATYRCWHNKGERGYTVSNYLKESNLEKIAIYGLGEIGRDMISELTHNGVEIAYCVDKNGCDDFCGIKCYGTENILPEADLLIVTLPFISNEIKQEISSISKNITYIKSVQEVLYVL